MRAGCVAAGLGLLLALAVPASASANHKWSKYHWARTDTSAPVPLTVDQTLVGGSWAPLNDTILGDWNAFSGGVLTVSGPGGDDILAESANYGATGWLGLAQIRVDIRSHIVDARVKLNDYYYGPGSKYLGTERSVYCQEVGHTFGLGHNRNGKRGGTPDDSCMNDQAFWPAPNSHDTAQLVSIYNHSDGYSTARHEHPSASGWITIDRVHAG